MFSKHLNSCVFTTQIEHKLSISKITTAVRPSQRRHFWVGRIFDRAGSRVSAPNRCLSLCITRYCLVGSICGIITIKQRAEIKGAIRRSITIPVPAAGISKKIIRCELRRNVGRSCIRGTREGYDGLSYQDPGTYGNGGKVSSLQIMEVNILEKIRINIINHFSPSNCLFLYRWIYAVSKNCGRT